MTILPVLRRIRRTQRCDRRKLRFPKSETYCRHCTGLDEAEVEKLRENIRKQSAANARLGKLFLIAAVLLLAALFAVGL